MAYIDPNTGGMLFQLLAAGFALLTGSLLFFSGKIRSAVNRLQRRLLEKRYDEDSNQKAFPEEHTKEKDID